MFSQREVSIQVNQFKLLSRKSLCTVDVEGCVGAFIDGVEEIIWYFNHCVEDDIKPTVSGMCNALGIERKTFYQWQVGECRERSHTPIIKKARAILEEMWEDWMVDGKINPVVGIFLGKNHFGYADKQDIIVTPNNPLGEARDPEEVRQRYLDSVVVDELPPDDGEEND